MDVWHGQSTGCFTFDLVVDLTAKILVTKPEALFSILLHPSMISSFLPGLRRFSSASTWPRVAIVGVGQLGAAVATNLVRNNVPLTLFDIEGDANVPSELADKLKSCEWASSAREAAENAEVVITALPRPGNY